MQKTTNKEISRINKEMATMRRQQAERKIINTIDRKYPFYFSKDTLDFFGERMSDMHILKDIEWQTDDWYRMSLPCYVLQKYSKKHPDGARHTYAYFSICDYEHI